MSTISFDDENDVTKNSNQTATTDNDYSSPRLITLVTEDVEIDIALGKKVKAWTFNGTVPGPTIRLTEGENLTIKYINKSPIPHTIHFHGNHDDVNDGVIPQVMPGQTYLYNITGEPAGALMYHCHAPPTSLHIRMGMYGALIVDPVNKELAPAKEFVMVMGEYSLKNQIGFEADY
jgi:nitrite reductase (NO-forming)